MSLVAPSPTAGRFTPNDVEWLPSMEHPQLIFTVMVLVGALWKVNEYERVIPPDPSDAHPDSPSLPETHAHCTVLLVA
jgi:hypothetical protein